MPNREHEYDPTPEEAAEPREEFTVRDIPPVTEMAVQALLVLRSIHYGDAKGEARYMEGFRAACNRIPPEDEPTYDCPFCRGRRYVQGRVPDRESNGSVYPCGMCPRGALLLRTWEDWVRGRKRNTNDAPPERGWTQAGGGR